MINLKEEYDSYLEQFMELSEELVDSGMPYMAVILNHELFRYLYPFEPYADFQNNNPVNFIIGHIQKLIDTGRMTLQGITPYEFNLSETSFTTNSENIEQETSSLYEKLWEGLNEQELKDESLKLLRGRLSERVIKNDISGKEVLDMGCGSGRYSLALSSAGAKKVIGADYNKKSFEVVRKYCEENKRHIQFEEVNFLDLPFEDQYFDFVFCNGTIHHSRSILKSLEELKRVLKKEGKAFIYIYAKNGIFWDTRVAMRKLFKKIPLGYTQKVLDLIAMPTHRFIFCDVWYVPVELHTDRKSFEIMLRNLGFEFQKIVSNNPFDLDGAIDRGIKDAKIMWGDGEHRYILRFKA